MKMKTLLTAALCAACICSACALLGSCGSTDDSSDTQINEPDASSGAADTVDSGSADSDSSLPQPSEPDSGLPSDGSSDVSAPKTPKEICSAFLESTSNGDASSALSYCSGDVQPEELGEGFKYEITSESRFTSSENETYTVFTVSFREDGMLKEQPLYVIMTEVENTPKVFAFDKEQFPASLLEYLGVDGKQLEGFETQLPAENADAKALALMANDVLADAENNGASVGDGEYTKNDGSAVSSAINANLEPQGIAAFDYTVTVSGGRVVSVQIYDENGNAAGRADLSY